MARGSVHGKNRIEHVIVVIYVYLYMYVMNTADYSSQYVLFIFIQGIGMKARH